ncbi:MAG TPA: sugar ABC transporter substrate-binding protein [Gaiellaceae bacterium]|nr:sugar ABC transporter substrate-binding protein [Gaiellaceae bacterium]
MNDNSAASRHRRAVGAATVLAAVVAVVAALAGTAAGASARPAAAKPVRIAYLSFAVANSYDAPMLAAAEAAAKKGKATITVFDAKNDPKAQFAQLQTAATSKQYDAIIVQPIFGTGLITVVKQAIANGIKVVNMDQELGANLSTAKPQVKGLSGNVVFVPTLIGKHLGQLTVRACHAKKLDPCNVGYLYDIKASALDVAIRKGFDGVVGKRSSIKVVAEGQSYFTPATALQAVQTMIQANPDMNLVVGSDQGIEGAVQAVDSKKVGLVGYGGSVAGLKGVASGAWFGTIVQLPASEGRLAVQCAIKAVRKGKGCGGVDPVDRARNHGIVTKANVAKFKGEWPG